MNNDRRKQLAALLDALSTTGLRDAMDNLQSVHDELDSIKSDEEDARENLPDSLRDGEKGDAMQEAIDKMDDALCTISELIEGFDFDRLDEAFTAIDDARA